MKAHSSAKRRKLGASEENLYEEQTRTYSRLESSGVLRRSSRAQNGSKTYVDEDEAPTPPASAAQSPFQLELHAREQEYGGPLSGAKLYSTKVPRNTRAAQLLPPMDLSIVTAGLERELGFTASELLVLCRSCDCTPLLSLFKDQFQSADLADKFADLIQSRGSSDVSVLAETIARLSESYRAAKAEADVALAACGEFAFWLYRKNSDGFFYHAGTSPAAARIVCARLLLFVYDDVMANVDGFFNRLLSSELRLPMPSKQRRKWEECYVLIIVENVDIDTDSAETSGKDIEKSVQPACFSTPAAECKEACPSSQETESHYSSSSNAGSDAELTFEELYRKWRLETEQLDREKEESTPDPLLEQPHICDTDSDRVKVDPEEAAQAVGQLSQVQSRQEKVRLKNLTEQYLRAPEDVTMAFEYLPDIDFLPFNLEEQLAFLLAYRAETNKHKRTIISNAFEWRNLAAVLPRRPLKDCIQHYYANHSKLRTKVVDSDLIATTNPAQTSSAAIDSPLRNTLSSDEDYPGASMSSLVDSDSREQPKLAKTLSNATKMPRTGVEGEGEPHGSDFTTRKLIKQLAEANVEIQVLQAEQRAFRQVCEDEVEHANRMTKLAEQAKREILKERDDLLIANSEAEATLTHTQKDLSMAHEKLISASAIINTVTNEHAAAQKELCTAENKVKEMETEFAKSKQEAESAVQQKKEDAAGFSKRLQDRDNAIRELVQMLRDRGVEVPQHLCKHEHRKK